MPAVQPAPPSSVRDRGQPVLETRLQPVPQPVLETVQPRGYGIEPEPMYRIEPDPLYLMESEPTIDVDPVPPAPDPTRRRPRRGTPRRTT